MKETCLLLILGIGLGLRYEYDISRGKNLWSGHLHGLHYLDHFALLSNRLTNVTGAVSTFSALRCSSEASISFDLESVGSWEREGDGFSFYLGRKPLETTSVRPVSRKRLTFEESMPRVSGVTFYIRGRDKKRLYFKNLSGKDVKRKGVEFSSCEMAASGDDLHLTLRITSKEIKIYTSESLNRHKPLVECGKIPMEDSSFSEFFLAFYAQATRPSFWKAAITNVYFESDVENPGLIEFGRAANQNLPRLFKNIHILSAGQKKNDELKQQFDQKSLNISQIHSLQAKAYFAIDRSNHLMSQNLDESDELLSFVGEQRKASEEYGLSLIEEINRWISSTSAKYEELFKGAIEVSSEIESFDFQAIREKSSEVVAELKENLKKESNFFQKFKKLSESIHNNLVYLELRQKDFSKVPELINRLLHQNDRSKAKRWDLVFLLVLCFVGVVVIVTLFAILFRLKLAARRKAFS